MRAVVQRVTRAKVEVGGEVVGEIGRGLVVLLGVGKADTRHDADYMAGKITALRVFADESGKMNRSVLEARGSLLVISQFTLYGDVSRGNRPGFDLAAPPELARSLYDYFLAALAARNVPYKTGVFQAHMTVELVNDGPVTILVSSDKNT